MEVHYSSKKHTWETPQDFFDKLNNIFNFNLDSCAETDTTKCSNFYTKEDDALAKDWKGVVWCNHLMVENRLNSYLKPMRRV